MESKKTICRSGHRAPRRFSRCMRQQGEGKYIRILPDLNRIPVGRGTTFSSGPVGTDCTYSEGRQKGTLTCGPQTMELTIDSDGNLNGPPKSIGKLIKKNSVEYLTVHRFPIAIRATAAAASCRSPSGGQQRRLSLRAPKCSIPVPPGRLLPPSQSRDTVNVTLSGTF